jgi:hypothetical protein
MTLAFFSTNHKDSHATTKSKIEWCPDITKGAFSSEVAEMEKYFDFSLNPTTKTIN